MLQNFEEQDNGSEDSKNAAECEGGGESLFSSMLDSPNQSSRPTSMVMKKVQRVIPAHVVAEAISRLHGVGLRWSGPITPKEMQYVEQYVLAKYPEYCNGLIHDQQTLNPYPLSDKIKTSSSASTSTLIQLEPSKLRDTLTKKTCFEGNFISIPEIQARNGALQNCGLTEEEEDYLVVFSGSAKEAMMMIGESYPFFRGNYYMTVLKEESDDVIREFVSYRGSKVVAAPETWLDLRIKGSQLSQYFRRKCKHSPKGLFAYAANIGSARSSMHWISEAHRNSWHVLLDASGLDIGGGKDRLALALHRPDFVICTLDHLTHSPHPSKITCRKLREKCAQLFLT